MKKLFLCIALFIGSGAVAQQKMQMKPCPLYKIKSASTAVSKAHQRIPKIVGTVHRGTTLNNNPSRSISITASHAYTRAQSSDALSGQQWGAHEAVIGKTTFDMQTNGT